MYMKETLGATDADLARREDIRYDRFGVSRSSNTPPARSGRSKDQRSRAAGRNTKDSESEDEESSEESDDDDDRDEDDENENIAKNLGDIVSTKPQSKVNADGPLKGGNATRVNQTDEVDYEEFLRFQEMKKKRGK